MGLEWLRWWHVVVLVFVAIEIWGWAEKQPRLYIRMVELYLKSRVKFDARNMEYIVETTRDSSKAISFFKWNPFVKRELKKLHKFETGWEIKSLQIMRTSVSQKVKTQVRKLKKK